MGRSDPFIDLLNLQERMSRLFDERLSQVAEDETAFQPTTFAPPADVYETPEAYVVEIEVPGVRLEELKLQIVNGLLTVRGERSMPREPARPEIFLRMERTYGAFSRSVRFGQPVAPEPRQIELHNGLLVIELAKAAGDPGS